jgi:hypothetical protein
MQTPKFVFGKTTIYIRVYEQLFCKAGNFMLEPIANALQSQQFYRESTGKYYTTSKNSVFFKGVHLKFTIKLQNIYA